MSSTLADINSQIKKNEEHIAQLRKQAEELRNHERAGVIESNASGSTEDGAQDERRSRDSPERVAGGRARGSGDAVPADP